MIYISFILNFKVSYSKPGFSRRPEISNIVEVKDKKKHYLTLVKLIIEAEYCCSFLV